MKKFNYLIAAAAITLAGCSNDEFLNEAVATQNGGAENAITFTGFKPNMSRTQVVEGTAAAKLGYLFNVVGTKESNGTKSVFAQSVYDVTNGIASDKTYNVWYKSSEKGVTTTNQAGWEYVGGTSQLSYDGNNTLTLSNEQTIKYWDYTATEYDFVAYSATVNKAEGQYAGYKIANIRTKDNNNNKAGFTFEGKPEELLGLYIAKRKTVSNPNTGETSKSSYNEGNAVKLEFSSGGAKVRLGIYETVPGYKVTDIKFKYTNKENSVVTDENNAVLNGSFIGSSTSEEKITVTYENDMPVVTLDASNNETFFDFGVFDVSESNLLGTTAAAPTFAKSTSDNTAHYTAVFPTHNITSRSGMTLYVDYVLTAEDNSAETITVTGAKAVVPASYMTWERNHAYTYLFKISDNTNGTTGGDNDPAGLYPIIFDAVADNIVDNETQGTITTVAPISITTYQESSVVDNTNNINGVQYAKDKAITVSAISVDNNNASVSLSTTTEQYYTEVYKSTTVMTEADAANATNLGTKLDNGISVSNGVITIAANAAADVSAGDPAQTTVYNCLIIKVKTSASDATTPTYAYKVITF